MANEVINSIKINFAVDTADLSLSANYDPVKNTILAYLDSGGGYSKPNSITYVDGIWMVEIFYFEGDPLNKKSLYIIFDEDLKITRFDYGELPKMGKVSIDIETPSQTILN